MTMTQKDERMFLMCVRLLKEIGYGRMQQIISHEWYRHDPIGAALANTCYGLLKGDERAAYESLAKTDNLFRTEQPLLTPEMMARAIVSESDWWQPGPEFLIDFDRLREHIEHAIAFDRGYRK